MVDVPPHVRVRLQRRLGLDKRLRSCYRPRQPPPLRAGRYGLEGEDGAALLAAGGVGLGEEEGVVPAAGGDGEELVGEELGLAGLVGGEGGSDEGAELGSLES